MRRLVLIVFLAVFGAVLFETCRELANRSYVIFGIAPTTPDVSFWGGLIALTVMFIPILLLSRSLKRNP